MKRILKILKREHEAPKPLDREAEKLIARLLHAPLKRGEGLTCELSIHIPEVEGEKGEET